MKRHILLVAVALVLVAALVGGAVVLGGSGDAEDAPRLVATAQAADPGAPRARPAAPPAGDPRRDEARGEAQLGVVLGAEPLPPLLVEHLRLAPGQGLVIDNVAVGSPADLAGLEQDDLLLALDGRPVGDPREVIDAVRSAAPGELIELEVMHEGQRRTLEIELAARERGEPTWKFPSRERALASGALPRGFGADLDALLDDSMLRNGGAGVRIAPGSALRQMHRVYTEVHASPGGERVEVTVTGDPELDDSEVLVRQGDNAATELRATVGTLDTLPPDAREAARRAVENARQTDIRMGTMLPGSSSLRSMLDRLGTYDELFLPSDPHAMRERADRLFEEMFERAGAMQQLRAPRHGSRL